MIMVSTQVQGQVSISCSCQKIDNSVKDVIQVIWSGFAELRHLLLMWVVMTYRRFIKDCAEHIVGRYLPAMAEHMNNGRK